MWCKFSILKRKQNMKTKKKISLVAGAFILAGSFISGTGSQKVLGAAADDAITKVAPIIVKYDDKGGMLPSVKIAQVLLESGNLTSELAVKANNPVGMKFSAPFSNLFPENFYYKSSGEYGSGSYNLISPFRKYDCLEDALKDHAGFFTSSDFRKNLYSKALSATNYKDQANALTGTYATSPYYGRRLIEIIEKYGLQKYDGTSGSVVVNVPVPAPSNPASPVSSDEYVCTSSVAVYATSQDAAKKVNSTKNYPAGKYFIYKSVPGAMNISRTKGIPGGWISIAGTINVPSVPETAKPAPTVPAVTKPQPAPSAPVVSNDGKIAVPSAVAVYVSADNAVKGINPSKTYPAGTYFVYKEAAGAINISRTAGVPGAWIKKTGTAVSLNPTAPAVTKPKATTPVYTANGDYVLNSAVTVYRSADDAVKGINAAGTYAAGSYFVYKTSGNSLNISRVKGTPGAWISAAVSAPKSESKVSVFTEPVSAPVSEPVIKKETTPEIKTQPEVSTGDYTLGSETEVYGTASDAVNGTNSVNVYPAGSYYIYKSQGGAINISRNPGAPGAWIKAQ